MSAPASPSWWPSSWGWPWAEAAGVLSAQGAQEQESLLREQSSSAFKTAQGKVQLWLADPLTSATGTASLLMIRQAAGAGGQGLATSATSLRTAQTVTPGSEHAAFATLTSSGMSDGPTVLVDSEQAVWRQTAGTPGQYAVIYPRAGTAALDFPFAVLTADLERQRLAARLQDAPRSSAGISALHRVGLRDPDGCRHRERRLLGRI